MDWIIELGEALNKFGDAVLVTLARVDGSAPRAAGTKMVVHRTGVCGTIGGGNLEHQVIVQARKMIDAHEDPPRLQNYPLGPLLNQCCGGHVAVLLERMDVDQARFLDALKAEGDRPVYLRSSVSGPAVRKELVGVDWVEAQYGGLDLGAMPLLAGDLPATTDQVSGFLLETLEEDIPRILIFGAGHVGRALVSVLASLNVAINWIDGRRDEFPDDIPDNVSKVISDEPLSEVDSAPVGSHYLVMTHSHDIDYQLVCAILRRGDARYCGLIGSVTKRARFVQRMKKESLTEDQIAGLTCPIGVPETGGKRPEEIAISVAAQILQTL